LAAPKPLTERERQLAEIAANEKIMIENMKGGAHRKSHAPGMSFPLTEKAVAALKKLLVEVTPVTAVKPKVAAVASALPKKFSSPASTPLPASPVISAGKTVAEEEEEPKKRTTEATVDEDEWDDDETVEVKKVAVDKEEEEVKVEETVEETEVEEASPVEEEPEAAPVKRERTINFVNLMIDAENEQIELAEEAKIEASQVNKKIAEDSPRFTFFAYEHTHKGTSHDSLGK